MNNHNDGAVEIQLTKGYVAIVDQEDADLQGFTWHASEMSSGAYAHRWHVISHSEKYVIAMHRVILERILGRPIKEKHHCDHINHDTLDNRRINLREVSQSVNFHNGRMRTINTSGYSGVSWCRHAKKWRAQTTINRKQILIGYFNDPKDAYKAYLEYKRERGLLPPESDSETLDNQSKP